MAVTGDVSLPLKGYGIKRLSLRIREGSVEDGLLVLTAESCAA